VSGKRESESSQQEDTYYAYECTYGSFSRTFTLPEGVDVEHAKSRLEHGVLTVELPRLPGKGSRKLPVKTL
jgi:HSP20 family protein